MQGKLSLLMRPYIICHMVTSVDGRSSQPALADGLTDSPLHRPTPLELFHTEALPNGVVWLRYRFDY